MITQLMVLKWIKLNGNNLLSWDLHNSNYKLYWFGNSCFIPKKVGWYKCQDADLKNLVEKIMPFWLLTEQALRDIYTKTRNLIENQSTAVLKRSSPMFSFITEVASNILDMNPAEFTSDGEIILWALSSKKAPEKGNCFPRYLSGETPLLVLRLEVAASLGLIPHSLSSCL